VLNNDRGLSVGIRSVLDRVFHTQEFGALGEHVFPGLMERTLFFSKRRNL
jgi:hypothetical protein